MVPIARRAVGVPARRPARGGGGRARGGRHGRPGVAADRRPVVLDAAGDRRPADLHEHPDALPRSAARRPGRQPDRGVPDEVPGAEGVAGAPGRAPRRRRGERALRLRQRPLRRLGHRLPAGHRARRHPLPAGGGERPGLRGRALVGPQLPGGPGPLVDGRPAPGGAPGGPGTRPPGRRPRGRRPDRRPATGHPAGPGHGGVHPAGADRARLDGRSPAGSAGRSTPSADR